jgi:hypothetical protein
MSAVTLEVMFNEVTIGQFTFQQHEWNKVYGSLQDMQEMSATASPDDLILVWMRWHEHDVCEDPDCFGELPASGEPDVVYRMGVDITGEYNNMDEGGDDPLEGWQTDWDRAAHWSTTPGGEIPPLITEHRTVDTGKKEEESETSSEPGSSADPGSPRRRGLQKWFKRHHGAEGEGK